LNRWTFAEATLIRTSAFIQLTVMLFGVLSPAQLFSAWALPHQEPATFMRFMVVAYGALGLSLLRAVRLPREEGRLTVETVALVKVAFVAVVIADILARKLPNGAAVAVILDMILGVAMFRAARRKLAKQ
jgi:hypothetical protein